MKKLRSLFGQPTSTEPIAVNRVIPAGGHLTIYTGDGAGSAAAADPDGFDGGDTEIYLNTAGAQEGAVVTTSAGKSTAHCADTA